MVVRFMMVFNSNEITTNTYPKKITSYQSLTIRHPLNKLTVTRNDDEISASSPNTGIYMIFFEQNCNNLKMVTIDRNV